MVIAMEDIKLDNITVIFPGKESFSLASNVQAVGLESYLK
jgi:hypothetical protein